MKSCCLFQRLLKVEKNGVFLFWEIFFALGIVTFLCYVAGTSRGDLLVT